MRDRLIKLIQDSVEGCARHWAEIIADHLLAAGVIVPPCKVGQAVYRITKLYNGETIIVEGKAFEFAITNETSQNDEYRFYFWAKPDKSHTSREYSIWCKFDEFGKTVFLTREKAEKALKGADNGT